MSTRLPLEGIRVADFSWVGAGPFLTKPLADHGADVVKVESRTRVDPIRSMAPFQRGVKDIERSGYFANRNSSKRSICLDLKDSRGRDLALRLIAISDVVVNNFSPGTMDRLGLGYGAARAVRPDVVYLEMPMMGTAGPYRDCRGYGLTDRRGRRAARSHRLRRTGARRHRDQLSRPRPQSAARRGGRAGGVAKAAAHRTGRVHRTRTTRVDRQRDRPGHRRSRRRGRRRVRSATPTRSPRRTASTRAQVRTVGALSRFTVTIVGLRRRSVLDLSRLGQPPGVGRRRGAATVPPAAGPAGCAGDPQLGRRATGHRTDRARGRSLGRPTRRRPAGRRTAADTAALGDARPPGDGADDLRRQPLPALCDTGSPSLPGTRSRRRQQRRLHPAARHHLADL